MQKTKDFLSRIGQPQGDAYDLPTSEKRFEDGAQYRFEVPGIQGPSAMAALMEAVEKNGVPIHRVTQTKGVMTLADAEITKMVDMAATAGVELVLSVGPRATTDTSASVNTPEGVRMGYRLRGQEQVIRATEEIRRGVSLGVMSYLVYDEGQLWLMNQMRAAGDIPAGVRFKVSAHTGHGNPCAAALLASIGANSFNPIRDIQIQMLAAIRQAVDIPLDVHTENPASTGGFIRHYEVPEMVRVAAPIYLKTGGSVAKTHSWDSSDADAAKRAKQVTLVKRMLDEYYPEAHTVPPTKG